LYVLTNIFIGCYETKQQDIRITNKVPAPEAPAPQQSIQKVKIMDINGNTFEIMNPSIDYTKYPEPSFGLQFYRPDYEDTDGSRMHPFFISALSDSGGRQPSEISGMQVSCDALWLLRSRQRCWWHEYRLLSPLCKRFANWQVGKKRDSLLFEQCKE
jgi:hypothetical protein